MPKSAEHHGESIWPAPGWLARELAAAGGRLPWRRMMELALYDPEHGYYSRPERRIGRGGDFFTSVSVGPMFGWLLAMQAVEVWRRLERPGRFRVVEQGAHDGRAAADLMAGLTALEPELAGLVEYAVVEPRESWRSALAARLEPVLGRRLRLVERWGDLAAYGDGPWPGMIWSNELVDAFPVERLRWSGPAGHWRQLGVELVAGAGPGGAAGLQWCDLGPFDGGQPLPPAPADGWETEAAPALHEWVAEVAAAGWSGLWLTIDYGGGTAERWQPGREAGSLRRFSGHQRDDDLLAGLGESDLTADVDFTELARATEAAAGLRTLGPCDQGGYLTRLAAPWLREIEAGAGSGAPVPAGAWQRQLATLLHPGWMGRRFKVLGAVSAELGSDGWRGFGGGWAA